jgi:hypothetical protein
MSDDVRSKLGAFAKRFSRGAEQSQKEAEPAAPTAQPTTKQEVAAPISVLPAPPTTPKEGPEAIQAAVVDIHPTTTVVPPILHGVSAYHAKFFAHEITRLAPPGGVGRVSQSLFDARVDLQPHQVEAGIFALRSPLSKGVILADEVGLGKTIEAGLVLCQFWAERKRRLLVICPASIRKQWQLELTTKFNLPSMVMEGAEYKAFTKAGHGNPFEQDIIVITSYIFASKHADDLRKVPWDLAVIDEAHRLRNAKTKASLALRDCLRPTRKVLLTATPLQNRLDELHSLATMVDELSFGDRDSFKEQYGGADADLNHLRQRLKPILWRTLRSDVKEYVPYTKRFTFTQTFDPTQPEHKLYEDVSEFLQREDSYALPKGQHQLMVLMLRKILASSSSALASTLEKIRDRLQLKLSGRGSDKSTVEELIEDGVIDEDDVEEFEEEDAIEEAPVDPEALQGEIGELTEFIRLARSIKVDSKSQSLLKGLTRGFEEMAKRGAQRKALIFTESRRTQDYLKSFLEANGYAGQIVLFNGSPSDLQSRKIYDDWLKVNEPLNRASGNRNVDLRTALIEYFEHSAAILIATEAGGEGVNMQFCSLVINYDLPWNPQRIEQRIGRCHRYGQKFDVAVVNFLNTKNRADERVLELLTEKFHLFKGVFGSSDEVLGTVESGVDFEKKVLEIYQNCRTNQDIEREFQKLQGEMADSIKRRFHDVRQKLLENFDAEVQTRFRNSFAEAQRRLNSIEDMFWRTTKYVLADSAKFNDADHEFTLTKAPTKTVRAGAMYQLIQRNEAGKLSEHPDEILYRISHPLGEHVLSQAKAAQLGVAQVDFKLSGHPGKITVLEGLKGRQGWLAATRLAISSYGLEEHLLTAAVFEDGTPVDPEVAQKLFQLTCTTAKATSLPSNIEQRLVEDLGVAMEAQLAKTLAANTKHFEEQQESLENWAQDHILSRQKELDDERARADDFRRQASKATNLPDRLALLKKQQTAEATFATHQKRIWDAQEEVRQARTKLIDDLHSRLKQDQSTEPLFTIGWKLT